ADDLAHSRFAAVATDEIGAAQRDKIARVESADTGNHLAAVLSPILDPVAVEDADARLRLGVRQQQRFKEYLVDSIRRSGCRPDPPQQSTPRSRSGLPCSGLRGSWYAQRSGFKPMSFASAARSRRCPSIAAANSAGVLPRAT